MKFFLWKWHFLICVTNLPLVLEEFITQSNSQMTQLHIGMGSMPLQERFPSAI